MTGLFITALVMGGIGTMHCVGMCGPLALSLPVVSNNNSSRFISTLLYNVGRIITYAFIGAVFGIIGSTFSLFGYQQWLSILLGVTILVFLLMPKKDFSNRNFITRSFEKLRNRLASLFHRRNYQSVFFIGLLNGLLPCGLVYMALAAAIATGSIAESSFFMAAFGLGTLPVMWSLAFFGGYVSSGIRQGIRKLYPYLVFVMAVLLIIRGLGLNIPYLSPALHEKATVSQQKIDCHD